MWSPTHAFMDGYSPTLSTREPFAVQTKGICSYGTWRLLFNECVLKSVFAQITKTPSRVCDAENYDADIFTSMDQLQSEVHKLGVCNRMVLLQVKDRNPLFRNKDRLEKASTS